MSENRLETGVVQDGDDWPGVFIRGDSAANFAFALRSLIERAQEGEDFTDMMAVHGAMELTDLLESCQVAANPDVQRIAAWNRRTHPEGEVREALERIAENGPEHEPEYQDWGGDTGRAEKWGLRMGAWEAARIARKALHDE